MAFTRRWLAPRYASTARVVRSASTRPMPVKPMTTLFPAMVPAKNVRPLKTPTSVAGAAAARSLAPSVGNAERTSTRALRGQAATGGAHTPAATMATTASLATNRLADQVIRSRISGRLHRSTMLDKTPFHAPANPVQLICELTCTRSCLSVTPLANRVEQRPVALLHRMALGVRGPGLEPQRLDDTGMLVVARVDEEQEGRKEELIRRGELLPDLLRLLGRQPGEPGRLPLPGELGERRQPILDDRPHHRRLLDRAGNAVGETERAGSRKLAIAVGRNDHVEEMHQHVLLVGREPVGVVGPAGVHQSSNRFARFFFIVSAM